MAIYDALQQQASSFAARLAERVRRQGQKAPKYMATPEEATALRMLEIPKRVREFTLQAYEPTWTKSILYMAALQNVRWAVGSRSWERQRVEDWIPQPVINKIQVKAQRIKDFFTRHRPRAVVRPSNLKETNRAAARLGEHFRNFLWEECNEDDRYDDAATHLIGTGNVFRRNFIDLSAGRKLPIPKYQMSEEPIVGDDGMPIVNPMTGQPAMSRRYVEMRDEQGNIVLDQIPQGRVNSTVHGPYEFTVPLAEGPFEEKPWVLHTCLYHVSYLRQCYPEKADFLPDEGTVVTSDLYTHRISTLLAAGYEGVLRALSPHVMEGYVLTNLYEHAPDRDFSTGVLIVEAEGVPLYIGELPLGTRFSFEHAGYYKVPGRFWCRGAIEDAIPIQDGINSLEQFAQVNDAFNGNPRTYVPFEAMVPEGAIKNKPGGVYRYKFPFKPETEPGVSVPPQQFQRRLKHDEDLDEVMGTRQVLMGGAPAGVTAGVALNALGEEAEGLFSPITKGWERFIERNESAKLALAARYYQEPQYFHVQADDGGVIEIHDFVGAMLMGQTRVKIEAGSYRPRSLSGQQQIAIDLFDRGLLPEVLTNPGERMKFLELFGLMGFGGSEGLDWQRARWENEMLARSIGWEQVHRDSSDDDIVHLRVHTDQKKTPEYLRFPNVVKQRFLMHEIEHLRALVMRGGMTDRDLTSQIQPDAGAGAGSPGASAPGQGGGPAGAPAAATEEPAYA